MAQVIPYKQLPDSWEQVECNNGQYEDVIFLDGHKFLDRSRATDYLVEQFGDRPLAEKYLGSLYKRPMAEA